MMSKTVSCGKMEGMDGIERIVVALRRVRISAAMEESEIHALVAAALEASGVEYAHERVIAPRCRADFLCGGVAIEIKKGRAPKKALVSQLGRYLESEMVEGIILLSPYSVDLPETLRGKPVKAVSLSRLNGVTLP